MRRAATNMLAQNDLTVATMLKFNKEQKKDLEKLQAERKKADRDIFDQPSSGPHA